MTKGVIEFGTSGTPYKGSNGNYKPCWQSHPLLSIDDKKTGKVYMVKGSSCTSDVPGKEVTLFIGLDRGMKSSDRRFPWTPGHEIFYPVTDMAAPANAEEFKTLIEWTAEHIRQPETRLMVGCIGGHGRTGVFLSALVAHMSEMQDAIQYVREHYCKKAVESTSQIKFLMKHFGCSEVEPTKGPGGAHGGMKAVGVSAPQFGKSSGQKDGAFIHLESVASPLNINGRNALTNRK